MKWEVHAVLFLNFSAVLCAESAKQNSNDNTQWWNGEHHYKIQLHDALTLQDCLDAGIRPRHVPAMGGYTLHFQAKSFQLILPNGGVVRSENGYGRLTVTKDYQVTTVAFYEEAFVDFERCRERLSQSNQAYGGSRTDAEIDNFLGSVRAAEGHWTGEGFSVGKTSKENSKNKYWSSSLLAQNQGTQELPFRFNREFSFLGAKSSNVSVRRKIGGGSKLKGIM